MGGQNIFFPQRNIENYPQIIPVIPSFMELSLTLNYAMLYHLSAVNEISVSLSPDILSFAGCQAGNN